MAGRSQESLHLFEGGKLKASALDETDQKICLIFGSIVWEDAQSTTVALLVPAERSIYPRFILESL